MAERQTSSVNALGLNDQPSPVSFYLTFEQNNP